MKNMKNKKFKFGDVFNYGNGYCVIINKQLAYRLAKLNNLSAEFIGEAYDKSHPYFIAHFKNCEYSVENVTGLTKFSDAWFQNVNAELKNISYKLGNYFYRKINYDFLKSIK